ncbi:deleted in malignant brain tumors 1 protein-like [Mya arenaria]|uniref:deleted in malignant brain tumors 1 protein-like n=1 Tax=Mya arenaria TaxID=6604 RepID=UPI0022E569A7|nr:deleted in malignant brain tumors 1 protein-like [Mya arenaria]
MLAYLTILLLLSVGLTDGLRCFNCLNSLNPLSCNTTDVCAAGQSCFQQRRATSQGVVFDMGCRDTQVCALSAMPSVVIGKRSVAKRQTANCHECCSENNCNGNLCPNSNSTAHVRLVGTIYPNQGMVEVSVDGGNTWGTICDDNFGTHEAQVVCAMLGYDRYDASSVGGAYFAQGQMSERSLLNNVKCVGTESSILECQHSGSNCGHNEDVAVTCGAAFHTQVRLVGSIYPNQGLVEISLNNGTTWGTICDDMFDYKEAKVICGMLGYDRQNVAAITAAQFGAGERRQPIVLQNVQCAGTESSILECQHNIVNVHTCTHAEDVGVSCDSLFHPVARLVGTPYPNEGRVELSVDNGTTWGTICDNKFGNEEAQVICGMLGYNRSFAVAIPGAAFGKGELSSQIVTTDVDCAGTEKNILDCNYRIIGMTSECSHDKDVAVSCGSEFHASVRLVGTTYPNQGRVEISFNNGASWGTICDNNFQNVDAQVVCAMLGYERQGAVATGGAFFGQGVISQQILLNNVYCTGTESSIMDCGRSPVGISNCYHSQDVGVTCPSGFKHMLARIDGFGHPTAGRVLISLDGGQTWGTVCQYNFDNNDAAVVCVMLGFQRTGAVRTSAGYYDLGHNPPILYGLNCDGSEDSLLQCGHTYFRPGLDGCGYASEAGVSCQT